MNISAVTAYRPGRFVAVFGLISWIALACSFTGGRKVVVPSFTPQPDTATVTATPCPIPTVTPTITSIPPTRAPTAAEIILVPNQRYEQSEIPKYTIQMDLPSMTSGGAAAQLFNNAVAQLAKEETERFIVDVSGSESWRQANMPDIGSDLTIQHRVRYNRGGLVSVQFAVSVYIAGAAHPNNYAHTINLDTFNPPNLLSLPALFLPGSDYLERIADHCAGELNTRDALQFPEGVTPTADNYRKWVFDMQGLVILFDPYQVAPYALGPQEITIPVYLLKPDIDPTGPFARVLE